MGEQTAISWCHHTWNPWWGCERVSPACDHCLPADTLVLGADLRPIAIGDLRVGDEVLSYTENPGVGENRQVSVATVEAKWATRAETVEFTTASGRRIVASADHRWLARIEPSFRTTESLRLDTELVALYDPPVPVDVESDDYFAGYLAGASEGDGTWRRPEPGKQYRQSQWYWRVAEPTFDESILQRLVIAVERLTGQRLEVRAFDGGSGGFDPPGGRQPMIKVETRRAETVNEIVDVIEARRESDAFAAGWLAGIVDTDGSHGTSNLRVGQSKPNDVRDTVKRFGARLGFHWRHENYNSCPTVRLYGDLGDRIRFAVTVRPAVTRKAVGAVIGMRMARRFDPVVAVARGPEADLVDIQTSAGTFFLADGMATHNCYAESTAKRYGHDIWGKGSDRRFFGDKHWAEPLKWDRKAAEAGMRRRVFCASMADVFENRDDLDEVRTRLWDLIVATPNLDWLLLTKRPEQILRRVPAGWVEGGWPNNAWAGTTVETQRYTFRLDRLIEVPAPVRFVSAEPLLGPLDLSAWMPAVSWVIVGGESGAGAREMEGLWALDLLAQCSSVGVDGWFKQTGSVLARELGVPGKGDDVSVLPEAFRVQRVPSPCG